MKYIYYYFELTLSLRKFMKKNDLYEGRSRCKTGQLVFLEDFEQCFHPFFWSIKPSFFYKLQKIGHLRF